MAKTRTKTTVRGERKIGERAGRASFGLGLVTLTFMRSQAGILSVPRETLIVAIGGTIIVLGLLSRSAGYKTGGSTGVVLGVLVFYFTFAAQHVTRLANKLQVGQYALVPYLLVLATVIAVLYVLHRPRKMVSTHETTSKAPAEATGTER